MNDNKTNMVFNTAWEELKWLTELLKETISSEVKIYVEDSNKPTNQRLFKDVDTLIAVSKAKLSLVDVMINRMERLAKKYG